MEIISRAAKYLPRTALVSGGNSYSYESLLKSAEQLSANLSKSLYKAQGPSKGSSTPPRVGLYAAPGPEYVVGTWAAWMSGCIAVPLATSHPSKELSYVFEDAGLSAALTGPSGVPILKDVAASHKSDLLVMDQPQTSTPVPPQSPLPEGAWGAQAAQGGGRTSWFTPGQKDPNEKGALIIYTSGTTGKPKGVLHTHRSLEAQVGCLVDAWEWSSSDSLLHPLPLHHIHGIVNALYCPLGVGARVEFLPKFSPSTVWSRIMAGEVSVFMGVPTMYAYLLDHYDRGLQGPGERDAARRAAAGLRLTVSGSAACPVPIINRWRELAGQTLLERYGMSETGMILSNPYRGERRPGTVGTPLSGVEVRVSESGELLVRGPMLFSEYWGRPEASREAFDPQGYFHTGDTVGLEGQPAYYSIQGRTSVDIIKSGGYKISALQIESALMEHPGMAECAVLGVPDEAKGQVIAALVVAKAGQEGQLTPQALAQHCKQHIADYQTPSRYLFLPSIPRNAMGKVNKKALLADFLPALTKQQ